LFPQEQAGTGIRYNYMSLRFLLAVAIGLAVTGWVSADENVREVQEKLRDGGFYSGEIDGAYSPQLAAALTSYQTRNRLPVTGQLDEDTSNALGAKPAVTKNTAAPERSSKTSRRLPRRQEQTLTNARERSSPGAEETESSTEMQPQSAPAATGRTSSEITESASGPPVTGSEGTRPVSAPSATTQTSSETAKPASAPSATVANSSAEGGDISTERLRYYVGAFVHAAVDPQVGSEADFFADRVKYYDQGVIDREQIRNDLQDYAARWPERRFWFVGNITIEQQRRNRVQVTFPLQYELRNGATYSSGTINKTLVLKPVGDSLQIVAVNERKSE
jgi:peptidoglycan hydrolase-like protein with peptidoglycan-binding domain